MFHRMTADIIWLSEDVDMSTRCTKITSAVKLGEGLGLKSLHESHAWIIKNFDSNRYGLLMDPIFMLKCVFDADWCIEGTLRNRIQNYVTKQMNLV